MHMTPPAPPGPPARHEPDGLGGRQRATTLPTDGRRPRGLSRERSRRSACCEGFGLPLLPVGKRGILRHEFAGTVYHCLQLHIPSVTVLGSLSGQTFGS